MINIATIRIAELEEINSAHTDTICQQLRELAKQDARIAELEGLLEREWQPISTAPKDRTTVLLMCPMPVDDVMWGHWVKHLDSWFDGSGTIPLHCPTHWQPLPNPPTQGASDE